MTYRRFRSGTSIVAGVASGLMIIGCFGPWLVSSLGLATSGMRLAEIPAWRSAAAVVVLAIVGYFGSVLARRRLRLAGLAVTTTGAAAASITLYTQNLI